MKIKCSQSMIPQQYGIIDGWKAKIKDGEIKYTIVNFGEDYEKYQYISIIKDLFAEVERHLAPIKFKSAKDESEGYIRIHFANSVGQINKDGKFIDNVPFPFEEDVLAYQYKGDMYINGKIFFNIKETQGGFSLLLVMLHELFHGLGLEHTNTPKDVLLPYYDDQNRETFDTQNGLDAIYGDDRRAAFEASHHWEIFRAEPIKPTEDNNCKTNKIQNMINLNLILAGVIDWFKAKTPKVYAGVTLVLLTIAFAADQNQFSELFGMSETLETIVKYVDMVLTALVGSRTVKFLPTDGVQALKDKDPNYLD